MKIEYTEKDIEKMKRKIHSFLTKLDGKSVPYCKIGPMMRYLTKGDSGWCCPLYDIQEYVHLTRTVNGVNGPTKVEYDEPTTVVIRADSLEAVDFLLENEKQKTCKLYKELTTLKRYIYIPESLREFWHTVAEWQPLSLQWAL